AGSDVVQLELAGFVCMGGLIQQEVRPRCFGYEDNRSISSLLALWVIDGARHASRVRRKRNADSQWRLAPDADEIIAVDATLSLMDIADESIGRRREGNPVETVRK